MKKGNKMPKIPSTTLIGIGAVIITAVIGIVGLLAFQYYLNMEEEAIERRFETPEIKISEPEAEPPVTEEPEPEPITPEVSEPEPEKEAPKEEIKEPVIKVLSPNGGEKWEAGKTYDINWQSSDIEKLDITIRDLESNKSCKLAENISADLGKYSYQLIENDCPVFTGEKLKIEIGDEKIKDESDGYFSITKIETCADECSEGETRCADSQSQQTCGNYDDDSCLEWSSAESCETDTTCGYGDCSSTQTPSWSCSEGVCLYECLYNELDCISGNVPPVLGTIDPSAGESLAGEEKIFTTTFRDSNGWQDIREVFLLINTDTARKYCFYGRYRQNDNKFYLRSDSDTDWFGGCLPGSTTVIENSYAKIDCSKVNVSGWGNALAVTWAITFKDTFAGKTYNSYLYVKDDAGLIAELTKKGEWTVNKSE